MANKENTTLRIEPDLKKQAAALFKALGMDLSTATGIFYRQALRYQGLPFEVRLDEPNELTYAAMAAAKYQFTKTAAESVSTSATETNCFFLIIMFITNLRYIIPISV